MSVIDVRTNKADGMPAMERVYDFDPLLGLRVPDPMQRASGDGDDEQELYWEACGSGRRHVQGVIR
jgi:hypothetical protein